MKLYQFTSYWKRIFRILFSFKKKVYVVCQPVHANLGDQAQLMCTINWLKENYPNHKIILLGTLVPTLNFSHLTLLLLNSISALFTLAVMKLKSRKDDVFVGHSGYFFVDHHSGYKAFMDMMRYFPNNRMIILPQTVNFYTPFIKQHVSQAFAQSLNTTLLCRDEVSYGHAQKMFPHTRLLLYPDIVTSLIGTRKYGNKREGVLFCMRDDIEAFYKPEQIKELMNRFSDIRKELIDTTLHGISNKEMAAHRETLINKTIERMATYRVVITDRYHGTIFSAIASTPVIVISSADHKLSSGVNWFPKDLYKGYIYYAKDLEEAYIFAQEVLHREGDVYSNPTYFKDNYWDKLAEKIK